MMILNWWKPRLADGTRLGDSFFALLAHGSISGPTGGLARVALGLGIVVVSYWWPLYYVVYRIPPGVDDRSGIALLAGVPFVYAGAIYSVVGLVNLWKQTRDLPNSPRLGSRFVGSLLFAPTFFAVLEVFTTGGISACWYGLRSWL